MIAGTVIVKKNIGSFFGSFMKRGTFILFSKPFASAEEFIHGKLRIIDGDTIVIKNQKIRLWGIDAPEMKQICKNGFKKTEIFF